MTERGSIEPCFRDCLLPLKTTISLSGKKVEELKIDIVRLSPASKVNGEVEKLVKYFEKN